MKYPRTRCRIRTASKHNDCMEALLRSIREAGRQCGETGERLNTHPVQLIAFWPVRPKYGLRQRVPLDHSTSRALAQDGDP
eukprot:CAMPEP_0174294632 /NCGR_PEP_ID=MMETSP0809-20121228/42220_1 /TAXON_ID=73025 ORGANISM="Eutreptiella gymnastica-like, Strain CCMP1594" /NCGR_SAMPLE_ID=MMETSP0809 /ASSEMBLY_ACC=CAM_ASM_000658 /LENGTH=80 /DNA_ID=CAMNT_0015396241 /DNA_START=39 /DNA_END=278 /DNA_ORIENTATION=-